MAIFENDVLKITVRQSESDTKSGSVLLSFTGIGHGMGGINVQKPEFFGAGRSFDNVIFITDTTRSWGNALDFEQIKDVISRYIGDRKVFSIGNSMGGFNAIISSHYIPTAACIAFVPQFSVSPSVVPWEKRWKGYTSQIKDFRFDSAADYMNAATKYYLFSGNQGADLEQAKLFPVRDNINHYAIHDVGHNVAIFLKERGELDVAVQSCLNGDDDLHVTAPFDRLSPRKS